MRTDTIVPTPSVERIFNAPPCSSASEREIASPSPEPVWFFENWFCTCSNGRPSFFSASLGMPQPLSSMVSIIAPETLRARTGILPPSPVNFTALESRLMAICLIARRSAIERHRSAILVSTLIDFCAACSDTTRTVSRISGQRSISSRSIENWPASIFDMSRMSLMTPSR